MLLIPQWNKTKSLIWKESLQISYNNDWSRIKCKVYFQYLKKKIKKGLESLEESSTTYSKVS